MRYGAVVFDLWNTLVVWPTADGRDFHGLMADEVGVSHDRFSEVWTALYHERATGPLEPSVREVCRHLDLSDEHVEGLISVRMDFTRDALVPRPGALEVLDQLRGRGLRLGLISVCSEEVPLLWHETPLAPRIDAPVFSCSVGVSKPALGAYRIAARRLGIDEGECLFVDDQPEFVQGAVAAGMRAVLIDSPEGAPEPEGLDRWGGPRIDRLEELLQLAE